MSQAPLDYKAAGVDYTQVDPLKVAAQQSARATAGNLAAHGYTEIPESRGESAYVVDMGDFYLASITECLGTKALIADQLRATTGKTYYDAIAQDTLAMAINDIITVGATPVSVHAYWAAGGSEWFSDAQRAHDLVNGWKAACDRAQVSWGGGETPALAGVVTTGAIDLAASCVGVVRPKTRLTLGHDLQDGDAIVFLAASGIHSNGVSLARKLSERLPQGYATPLASGRLYGEALLDPTPLYSPVTEALAKAGIVPHYSANITGHGWRKIMRHNGSFTYRLTMLPPVPEVLAYIQQHAGIDDREAYGTFNMGAGFALYLPQAQAEQAVAISKAQGIDAWVAGRVEAGPKRVVIEPLNLEYSADDLHLRA